MILSLEEAKQFLRIENEFHDEDVFINTLILSAESYITNATGKIFDDTNELAKLAVKLLISHWYDNRCVISISNSSKLSFCLDSIITQLTYCGGDSL